MLNETFANAVLGAMFGQGKLCGVTIKTANSYVPGSTGNSPTKSVNVTATEMAGADVTGKLGENCYIGLLTDWNDNGTLEAVQEYADADYTRVLLGKTEVIYKKGTVEGKEAIVAELACTNQLMSDPAKGEIHNKDFIKFNPLAEGASDVTFKGFALYAAASGGTAMYAAKLKEPLTGLSAGDIPVFHKNALSVTFGKDGDANTAAVASLSAE